jgi:hypothetical protein
MKLPDDMHGTVLDLAAALVHASEHADTRAKWRLYGELRDYCEAEAAAGRDHPFLWETLADFTTDDRVAIGFYRCALALAEQMEASEYEASIRLELAHRHLELDEHAIACAYALAADEQARELDDLDLRRAISQFLLDHLPASR